MADKKLTDPLISTETSLTGDMLTYLVKNPGGTPETVKGSLTNVRNYAEGSGSITGITWTGTAPTTAVTQELKWYRIGNIVFFMLRLEYTNAGASITRVLIPFPSGMPTPVDPTGASDLKTSWAVSHVLSTSSTTVPNSSRAAIRKDATFSTGYGIILEGGSGAYTTIAISGHYATSGY